jgi:hypothetical protein
VGVSLNERSFDAFGPRLLARGERIACSAEGEHSGERENEDFAHQGPLSRR